MIKDFFNFSKKETIGAITIFFLILLITIIPYLYNANFKKEVDPRLLDLANKAIIIQDTIDEDKEYYANNKYEKYNYKKESYIIKPFKFDPNTIDEEGLNNLGLPQKFIKTFINFRNKGAKFYKPEDFKKVWGLKEEDANLLLPYITIEYNKNNNFNKLAYTNNSNKTPKTIDINSATINEFRQLPGVGNIAYKIVKYRDKLGGFININQVAETYDLTDSIFMTIKPYLTLQNTNITKININSASDFELSSHPYIEKNIAKAIVIYRNQHGNYKQVNDLKKIIFIKKDLVDKIAPYLTVE